MSKGVILAVKPDGSSYTGSTSSALSDGADLAALWKSSNAKPRPGETRIFYGQGQNKDTVLALVGVGKTEKLSKNELLERSRMVAATGVKALKEVGCTEVEIETGSDSGLDAHAAVSAAKLALHKIDWKTSKADKAKKAPVQINQAGSDASSAGSFKDGGKTLDWATGELYSECQNLARELMELPANMCTPTMFAERAQKEFKGLDNVTLNVHDRAWAEEKGMRTFLSVANGSYEPPKFIELIYNGAAGGDKATDVAFVGKGITFDSGGISLKPGADMKAMKADMGGAAAVISSMLGIAKMKIPINMVVCIPLTENLPNGTMPTKPGDIIVSMSGKTIEVDNTDAEGRLVLADALYYATSVYKPKVVIDVATLTGAMMIALADVYSGAFVTYDALWKDLEVASQAEHDEFWRMPFHNSYLEYINKTTSDLCNTGGRAGGSCTAAIFLKQFVYGLEPEEGEEQELDAKQAERNADGADLPKIQYAHIDIAGTMSMGPGSQAYDVKGMSGKPVRSLIEYIRRRAYRI